MSMALGLLVFICIFALAIGLLGTFISSSDEAKRRHRSEHESRHHARQPWDAADGRSNR